MRSLTVGACVALLWVVGIGCSNPKAEGNGCTISGETIAAGALNPQNQCQVCNAQTNPSGWSNAPSGSSCGPGGSICAGGTCQAGCYISAVFFPTGAPDPAAGCLSCQPSVSSSSWSPFSGAPPPNTCPMDGVCYQGHCQPGCAIGTTAVPAGAANPENFCQSCQPAQGASDWTNKAPGSSCADGGAVCINGVCTAGCDVDGVFYSPGGPSPANVCQTCQPSFSVSSFTPATGLAPGGNCGIGSYCYRGQCSGGCSISGTSYAPGDPDPGSPCLGCVPGVSALGWSNLDPGTPCSDGGVCSGGVCLFSCDIGAALYSPGTVNPSDACSSCQPAASPDSWSPLTGIPPAGCSGGQICLDGGCAVGCYISELFKAGVFHAAGERKPGDSAQCCSPSTDPGVWSPAFVSQPALGPYVGYPVNGYYGAPQLIAADFNLDGRADLAVLSAGSSLVTVYLGGPAGAFVGATYGSQDQSAGTYSTALATGDLDADRYPDLIVSDSTGRVHVLMNRGDGTFGTDAIYDGRLTFYDAGPDDGGLPTYYSSGVQETLALGDVDRDGALDVVVAGGSFGSLSLLSGIGDGGLKSAVALSVGTTSTYSVGALDFDGDGAPDLLILGDTTVSATSYAPYDVNIATSNQALFLMRNDGKGSFGPPIPAVGFNAGSSTLLFGLTTGDFNGDGKPDVALSGYVLEVLLGLGDGGFSAPTLYGPPYIGVQTTVADFNGDGQPDLLSSYCGVSLFLNVGDGGFSAGSIISTPSCAVTAVAADFNGDGLMDLAIEDNYGLVSIWLNSCR
jgi:FG-GAP-like repeat